MASGNRIERLLSQVHEMGEARRESMRVHFAEMGYGTKRVSDEEFRIWFEMKTGSIPLPPGVQMKTFPPEPIVFPDGSVQLASPWALSLAFVEDGPELLARYERAVLKARYAEGQMMQEALVG